MSAAALRGYQSSSVGKLADQTGCLIAYDKRGGKTITSLALTEQRLTSCTRPGPILVISDKTSPWSNNFALAGLPGERLHLLETSRSWFKWLLEKPAPGHYYVVNWGSIVPLHKVLSGIHWHTIIADEVHCAKNRHAQRTIGLKGLRTEFKVGLTADPDDDVPPSLWSLLNWIYPQRYASYWRWIHAHFRVYEDVNTQTGSKYKVIGEPIDGATVRAEIEPFFVKLSMTEIDPGQPEDTIEEILVSMTAQQWEAYEQMVEWQMMELADDIVIADFSVVKFTRLQQLAQSMGRPETHWVWRNVREYDDDGNEAVVKRQVQTVKIHQVEPSPKLDAMMARINRGDLGPTVIYSQFPGMIDLACQRLNNSRLRYIAVRDSSQVNECETAFQRGDADLLLGTSGLISESIELYRADTLIFLDTHYNPRVTSQAIGRAKRVGKRTPVRVIYIRTCNSVDMIRLDRARTKQQWREDFLGGKGVI